MVRMPGTPKTVPCRASVLEVMRCILLVDLDGFQVGPAAGDGVGRRLRAVAALQPGGGDTVAAGKQAGEGPGELFAPGAGVRIVQVAPEPQVRVRRPTSVGRKALRAGV